MELEFEGEVWFWRGPAPHHFVTVPDDVVDELRTVAAALTYGWGCLPMHVRIGRTDFTTSLFPKDGGYIVPVKVAVRRAEGIKLGDRVTVRLRADL